MKKRILLSLVSFFMMTAMWASLIDAYQIYVTGGAGAKTGGTAELTLNLKNRTAIDGWQTTIVLPAGVTVQGIVIVDGRYPDGYNAQITTTTNEDGSYTFTCNGDEGITLTGTDGAIATVTVEIAATVEPKDYIVTAKGTILTEGINIYKDTKDREFTWTIEKGEEPGIKGDLNKDGKVDIADAVTVLNIIAASAYDAAADLNGDNKIDIADFVMILNIIAAQ